MRLHSFHVTVNSLTRNYYLCSVYVERKLFSVCSQFLCSFCGSTTSSATLNKVRTITWYETFSDYRPLGSVTNAFPFIRIDNSLRPSSIFSRILKSTHRCIQSFFKTEMLYGFDLMNMYRPTLFL